MRYLRTFRKWVSTITRWILHAVEGYGKSNLTYLILSIWTHNPIREYNIPAPSLHLTLQHKYTMEFPLTTTCLARVQDDNELYDCHITSFHPSQYNPLYHHTNQHHNIPHIIQDIIDQQHSHHVYPLRFLIIILSQYPIKLPHKNLWTTIHS